MNGVNEIVPPFEMKNHLSYRTNEGHNEALLDYRKGLLERIRCVSINGHELLTGNAPSRTRNGRLDTRCLIRMGQEQRDLFLIQTNSQTVKHAKRNTVMKYGKGSAHMIKRLPEQKHLSKRRILSHFCCRMKKPARPISTM